MKTKSHYQKPTLFSMENNTHCAEFATCSATGTQAGTCNVGSCTLNTWCMNTGTKAEFCKTGNTACGCDGCCGIGSSPSTSGYVKWTECYCYGGVSARNSCTNGTAAAFNCTTGSTIYLNENCS